MFEAVKLGSIIIGAELNGKEVKNRWVRWPVYIAAFLVVLFFAAALGWTILSALFALTVIGSLQFIAIMVVLMHFVLRVMNRRGFVTKSGNYYRIICGPQAFQKV